MLRNSVEEVMATDELDCEVEDAKGVDAVSAVLDALAVGQTCKAAINGVTSGAQTGLTLSSSP